MYGYSPRDRSSSTWFARCWVEQSVDDGRRRSFTAGSLYLLLPASRSELFSVNFGKQLEAATEDGLLPALETDFKAGGVHSSLPVDFRVRH
jgi:hypothetical protein